MRIVQIFWTAGRDPLKHSFGWLRPEAMRYLMCIMLFLTCGVAEVSGQKHQNPSVAKATEESLSSSTVSIDDLRDEMRGYIFRNTELEDSLHLFIVNQVENIQKLLK